MFQISVPDMCACLYMIDQRNTLLDDVAVLQQKFKSARLCQTPLCWQPTAFTYWFHSKPVLCFFLQGLL